MIDEERLLGPAVFERYMVERNRLELDAGHDDVAHSETRLHAVRCCDDGAAASRRFVQADTEELQRKGRHRRAIGIRHRTPEGIEPFKVELCEGQG